MSEESEIVYSASDILERMKTENIASIRWSFLLITHTRFKKDIDNPNQVCLMYWDINNLRSIILVVLLLFIVTAMFIAYEGYNYNFEIVLCVGSILIVLSTIIFAYMQKRYCYIDEEKVTVFRHAQKNLAHPGKVLLSLPAKSCQIGFRYNLFLHQWTSFLRNEENEHILSYNLLDIKMITNLMDKKPLKRSQGKLLFILCIILLAVLGISAVIFYFVNRSVAVIFLLPFLFILSLLFVSRS